MGKGKQRNIAGENEYASAICGLYWRSKSQQLDRNRLDNTFAASKHGYFMTTYSDSIRHFLQMFCGPAVRLCELCDLLFGQRNEVEMPGKQTLWQSLFRTHVIFNHFSVFDSYFKLSPASCLFSFFRYSFHNGGYIWRRTSTNTRHVG